MCMAFEWLPAFLIDHDLDGGGHYPGFFADGVMKLKRAIEKWFYFCPDIIILDWDHLEKHMY